MNAPLPQSVRKTVESASLDDKYSLDRGQVFMGGVQALVQLPMLKRQRDLAAGLNTEGVGVDRKLTIWGCGVKLRLVYAVNPRLARYSMGLSEPRDILIRFSLYQRI